MQRRAIAFVPAVRERALAGQFSTGDLALPTDWAPALAGCDAVVHLAGRVHQMQEGKQDVLPLYRAVNRNATLTLAQAAAASGVRRFIFASTVKVNGEASAMRPFSSADRPAPTDPYAQSKWEAEQSLREFCQGADMEFVIVRPPLVYGPGVRANFLRLMQLVRSGVPLPLGAVRNRRSMVGIGNLVDFLLLCIDHPAAANATWMVSDHHDVSVAELIGAIAAAMDKPARLLPVPAGLLSAAAALLGKRTAAARLLDSLQVDITPALQRLGWQPPVEFQAGIAQTVEHFLRTDGAQR
jgi:UDP-glucose 4-epimerase